MKSRILAMLLVLVLVSGTGSMTTASNYPVVDYPLLSTSYTTQLEVIIDPYLPLSSVISELEGLNASQYSSYTPEGFRSLNRLIVTYTVLSETNRSDFTSYLKSIEDTSENNGHEFNATAYNEGKSNVYTNITGRSYDAESSLNWIESNLWNNNPDTFSLFLFNLTDLDQGMDHWFSINPIDVDSNETQVSFFSGTNGLYNGKSVSAWGGHQDRPVHFLDFSSEVWFGEFINTALNPLSSGYYDSLLSLKLQDFASNESEAQITWMQDYLFSFISTTYDLYVFNGAPLGDNVKVQNLLLYDWYEYNLTVDDVEWIISTDEINQTFSNSFDWMKFNVTANWVNLSSYTDLVNEIQKYKEPKPNGEGYYIELFEGLLTYIENTFIPQNFDQTGEDIILPSLVFLLNQSTFTVGGLPIAGIGGMGFQLQGLTPDRYYDNGEPNRGFSDVILHEVGHSLGLPHPFGISNFWPGDMVASVMGYYTSAPDFSQYDVNTLGNYHASYYRSQAEYLQSIDNEQHDYVEEIDALIIEGIERQRSWDFRESIELMKTVLCLYTGIYNQTNSRCDNPDFSETTSSIISEIFSSSSTTSSSSINSTPPLSSEDGFLFFSLSVIGIVGLIPIFRRKN